MKRIMNGHMTERQVKEEMDFLLKKGQRIYKTLGNTQECQDIFKRYYELEDLLNSRKTEVD